MEQLTLDETKKIEVDLDDITLPKSVRDLRPTIYEDCGDYCAVFGPRREEALVGTGSTPHEALLDWDMHLNERFRVRRPNDTLVHYIEDRLREAPRFPDEGDPVGATDENGDEIKVHDILFDGSHYYHLYRTSQGRLDAISCTHGYVYDLQPEELKEFRRIGSFSEFHKILICDD